jgi:hypothetical protein
MELVEGRMEWGAAGAGQPFHCGRALRWPLVVERAYKYDIAALLYRNLEILDFPAHEFSITSDWDKHTTSSSRPGDRNAPSGVQQRSCLKYS